MSLFSVVSKIFTGQINIKGEITSKTVKGLHSNFNIKMLEGLCKRTHGCWRRDFPVNCNTAFMSLILYPSITEATHLQKGMVFISCRVEGKYHVYCLFYAERRLIIVTAARLLPQS